MADLGAVAPPKADGNTTPPLFRLPRELRDKIYGLVWGKERTLLMNKDGRFFVVEYECRADYRMFRWPLQFTRGDEDKDWLDSSMMFKEMRRDDPQIAVFKGSAWLLTNKQILHEGLEEFQRKAIWLTAGMQLAKLPDLCLMSPYTARLWEFNVALRHEIHRGKGSTDTICLEKSPVNDEVTKNGLKNVRLRQLKITLFFREEGGECPKKAGVPVTADLSSLGILRHLGEVHNLQIDFKGLLLSREEYEDFIGRQYRPYKDEMKFSLEHSLSSAQYHATKGEILRIGRAIMAKDDTGDDLNITEEPRRWYNRRSVTFNFEKSGKKINQVTEA